MLDSSRGLSDSFELVFSNPSILVPVFLEEFFVFSIFVTSLLPLVAVAGRSIFSNWHVFFSAFHTFSLFFSFVFLIDLFLALLAVSFCRSIFLSMAHDLWSRGSSSLSGSFSRGMRYLKPLFFANLFFYALSGLFLLASLVFFFSALNSSFPVSVPLFFFGFFSFLCFCLAFFSFFWREPALLMHGGWPAALSASFSLFVRESSQTVRLWLIFFLLEALAGSVGSGGAFLFLSFFLGILVSAYVRLAKACIFLDASS